MAAVLWSCWCVTRILAIVWCLRMVALINGLWEARMSSMMVVIPRLSAEFIGSYGVVCSRLYYCQPNCSVTAVAVQFVTTSLEACLLEQTRRIILDVLLQPSTHFWNISVKALHVTSSHFDQKRFSFIWLSIYATKPINRSCLWCRNRKVLKKSLRKHCCNDDLQETHSMIITLISVGVYLFFIYLMMSAVGLSKIPLWCVPPIPLFT